LGQPKEGTAISKNTQKGKDKPADAERRAHPRYGEPVLAVGIGKDTFKTINWSMGGMAVEGYKGNLSVGSIFKIVSLARADGGAASEVGIEARVIRLEKDGSEMGLSFLEVDGRAYALLQAFMAERMALLNEFSTNY